MECGENLCMWLAIKGPYCCCVVVAFVYVTCHCVYVTLRYNSFVLYKYLFIFCCYLNICVCVCYGNYYSKKIFLEKENYFDFFFIFFWCCLLLIIWFVFGICTHTLTQDPWEIAPIYVCVQPKLILYWNEGGG